MSFLAKLRTNQNQNVDGTSRQLCYFLHVNQQGHAYLSLKLSRLSRTDLIEDGSPYIAQREHCLQPPPFLNAEDVKIVSALMDLSLGESQTHSFGLFPEPPQSFIEQLIGTGRCFTGNESGGFSPILLGGDYSAEPFWCVASDGVQCLTWSTPKGTQLWSINHHPYAFSSRECRLDRGVGFQVDTSLERIATQIPIEPNAIGSFTELFKAEWLKASLPLPHKLGSREVDTDLFAVLLFEGESVQLAFRYCSMDVCLQRVLSNGLSSNLIWDGTQLLVVHSELEEEQVYYQYLKATMVGFEEKEKGLWCSKSSDTWKRMILNHRETLETKGFEFSFLQGFKYQFVKPKNWSVNVKSIDESQWQLELFFDVDDVRVNVCDLLRQLRSFNESFAGEHVEVQQDGKTLVLSPDLINILSSELGDLLTFQQLDGPLPYAQIHRLKKIKDQLPNDTCWVGDNHLLEQSVDLHSSPIMLDQSSSGVKAELRPYQWLGVCWIQHLKNCSFNGLLADDMGLGKTLQALAHLSLEYRNTHELLPPSLIVAPTSLLSNWAAEIKKFCPHLSFVVLHGTRRHELWETLKSKHIVITSYPLVVRDLEYWCEQRLHWLVLDEAQLIKNVNTKASQAVRALDAMYRLCLSGTPVENHLGELWSIFDFLQPQLLGSQNQFKDYFQKPIELDANQPRFEQLCSHIEPFIMRRTKSQVAKDLPKKTQIQKLVTLSEEQLSFYENLKNLDKERLDGQIKDADNKGQQQILLLTAITRLRQACCDPRLLGDKYLQGDMVASAKTQFCLEMLDELVAEGRSVLVFSQFTSMLDILSENLDSMNLSHKMLTGKSKNRQQLVEQFQAGDYPVFLISLKAGGVGLNLTRADTVIHFDPWWNHAAEEQASDRAHRIGQKNPVFVYKLIAADTIEEKIALLQKRKSLLTQQVNRQAQLSGESFALKLEDLLSLYD